MKSSELPESGGDGWRSQRNARPKIIKAGEKPIVARRFWIFVGAKFDGLGSRLKRKINKKNW